ncbi:hypothetical protein K1719_021734 [Acacia pycnantha]|nr:hypothetical protein K1719_021734 [Acacia pycnantha]
MRQSQEEQCIFAGANELEENESKWSCTLFKPNYVDVDARRVQFFHVQVGCYSQVKILEPYFYLYVGSNDSVDYVYKIIDWESLLITPKHVAFKGDNGQYLSARWIDRHQYLQFASNDVGDPTVVNEIFTTHDGSIRVKSDYFGKFWRGEFSPCCWIWADSDDPPLTTLRHCFGQSKLTTMSLLFVT